MQYDLAHDTPADSVTLTPAHLHTHKFNTRCLWVLPGAAGVMCKVLLT